MRYTLAVLTHNDARHLEDCLASFRRFVNPEPATSVLVIDGPVDPGFQRANDAGIDTVDIIVPQGGFCQATRALWCLAAALPNEWVFWLEGDFLFTRPVDLVAIARTLDRHPDLAQMSLMRNAANSEETAAGGLVPLHPDWFQWHTDFMSQQTYWTTNPALTRASLMREHDWPLTPRCEGVFTAQLKDARAGTRFGVWGSGEPWVQHVGVRNGIGY